MSGAGAGRRGALRLWLALLVSAVLVDLLLILPNHPGALRWPALRMVPLELPVLLLGMLALGPRARPLAILASVALTLMTALKLADLSAYTAFGRGFDPLADMHLVPAAAHLLRGSAGLAGALGVGAALALLLGGAMVLLYRALRLWARCGSQLPRALRLAAGGTALVFALLCAAEIRTALNGWQGWRPAGNAFTARLGAEHIRDFARARTALAEFERAAATDPWAGRDGLLSKLEGRPVVIVFVESYGRRPLTTRSMRRAIWRRCRPERRRWRRRGWRCARAGCARRCRAGKAGWRMRRWRRCGGQRPAPLPRPAGERPAEPLQPRQPRRVSHHGRGPGDRHGLARRTGHGVSGDPRAAELGYRGLPFNWVTMPDQYTLAEFDRIAADQGAPLMAEIALISSHAPWTPVPQMVPWQAVGMAASSTPRPPLARAPRRSGPIRTASAITLAARSIMRCAMCCHGRRCRAPSRR
ncbi:sulfatase [Salipiger sp. CCB-MM3]|uniref:sulfatase n=1 Tax=Salipiger sp. CCB-MM3 TaxID=1792508 RepID=UPI000A4FE7E3|nr:sulfatase [Salipiger sp. CCB-MM3]